ncbi:aldose 1-epimerase family protein [Microbacterium sp. GXF7504]
MTADPTGHRHVLRSAHATAEITEVGASLRALRVDGVDLVVRYPDGIPAPAASGVVLLPWPNRIRDGRWRHDGTEYLLAITEPKLGNASHGLLRFASYRLEEATADAVTLAADVVPQTGYPFHLATRVTYALTPDGIEVTHTVTNVGADEAPVALGAHPYLGISDVATEELTVQVVADEWYPVDERNLPVGAAVPVDDAHDLRTPRLLAGLGLDTAYTAIRRDADGRVRGVLRAPDGRSVELWGDESVTTLQVFTTDRYPGHDLAVAIEPMTAPADAFNSGRDLRRLAPGETWEVRWGIVYRR